MCHTCTSSDLLVHEQKWADGRFLATHAKANLSAPEGVSGTVKRKYVVSSGLSGLGSKRDLMPENRVQGEGDRCGFELMRDQKHEKNRMCLVQSCRARLARDLVGVEGIRASRDSGQRLSCGEGGRRAGEEGTIDHIQSSIRRNISVPCFCPLQDVSPDPPRFKVLVFHPV